MPETSIFIDSEDEHALVLFVLDTGGRLVASRQPVSDYVELSTSRDYLEARKSERLFFVLYDCYTTSLLYSHRIEGGYYKGTYSIDQRVGGPAISFLTSVQYEKKGIRLISDGSIAYYPSYQDPRTDEMQEAPDLLILQYKTIVKELTKGGKVCRGSSGRRYLIGKHTYKSIKEGKLQLGVPGLHVE